MAHVPDDQDHRDRTEAIARGRGAWKKLAHKRDVVAELLAERRADAELADAELASDPEAAQTA